MTLFPCSQHSCIDIAEQVSCASIVLSWQPPEALGHPPFHKYKLQRSLGQPGNWVTANRVLDDEDTTWVDPGIEVCLLAVYPPLRRCLSLISSACWSADLECHVGLQWRITLQRHGAELKGVRAKSCSDIAEAGGRY